MNDRQTLRRTRARIVRDTTYPCDAEGAHA